MALNISPKAKEALNQCDLAKSLTGATPDAGTRCYLFVQDEAGRLNKKCDKCPYYAELTAQLEGVSSRETEYCAVVEAKGMLGESHVPALKSALEGFASKGKAILLLDCSSLFSMPMAGLGHVLRAYKAAKATGKEFYLVNVQPGFNAMLEETRVSRVFSRLSSVEEGDGLHKRREEEKKTGEARAKEEKKQKLIVEAQTVRCWEFFKGHNPKNATGCVECHYKVTGGKRPCWIIVGDIDGVTFESIDEGCTSCAYFLKYNPEGNLEIQW